MNDSRFHFSAGTRFRGMTALLALLCGSLLGAEAPLLEQMHPPGAQKGSAVTLTVSGKSLGGNLKVLSSLPASFTPLAAQAPDAPAQDVESAAFLVEVRKDAAPGLYPIRVHSDRGLSNVLLFSVGEFPEVNEEKEGSNDTPAGSQPVPVPVTVNGTLEGPDRDVYRFRTREGERVVLEVEGRRVASALDPVLLVLDSQGKQVARNDDAPGIGVDSRLDLSLPEGDYYAVVQDARFSRQDRNFYRLKIGAFDYAEGVFPLGWQRGENVKVQMVGGSPAGPREVPLDLSGVDGEFVMLQAPGVPGALPLPFVVGDLPERLEPEDQPLGVLEPSTVVNGRISAPGEVDRYRLQVAPGEEWSVHLAGSRLGTTRLFGRVSVLDSQGKLLASGGDQVPLRNDSFRTHGDVSRDPHLNFKVPDGAREMTVTVEDLVGRGGPDYAYRLSAWKGAADFTVSVLTPYLNVPRNGTVWIEARIDRRGYTGAVRLEIPDAGEDLLVEGGDVPPELVSPESPFRSAPGILTVTAKSGASQGVRRVSVRGTAVLPDGTRIERWARAPGLITAVKPGTGLPEPSMRMREEPFTAPWLGLGVPVNVSPETSVRLELAGVSSERLLPGMDQRVTWRMVAADPAVTLPRELETNRAITRELRIRAVKGSAEDDPGTGAIVLATTMGTVHGKFNFLAEGEVEIRGRKQTIRSRALTFDVVQGYHIRVEETGLTLQPGGSGYFRGRVERDPLFDRPVNVQPENFPNGVLCEPVQVGLDQEEFQIPCRAGQSVQPGEYAMELSSSSTLATRTETQVPYRIPSVATRLIVAGKESQEDDTGVASLRTGE